MLVLTVPHRGIGTVALRMETRRRSSRMTEANSGERPAMLTQIYEVSTPAEAAAISAIGVTHIGVLTGDGRFPREQPIDKSRSIAAAIVAPAKLSALFLSA